MRHVLLAAWIGAFAVAIAGCNSATDESPQVGTSTTEASGAGPKIVSDGRTPQEVVQILMDAMLAHDQAKVDLMLTEKARLANALKADTPPNVRFKVGDTELIGDGNAHVAAAWFYPNEDGSEYRVMTMWMLRKDPIGFRVYGNIMIVPELAKYDGGKVAFDFEDADQFAATESRVLELLAKERESAQRASVAEKPGPHDSPAQQ